MKILLPLFIVILFSPAYAKDYEIGTIQGLYDACKNVMDEQADKKEFDERGYGLCLGYMRGVKDSYDMRRIAGAKGNICEPDNTTWIELIKVFMHWADEYPRELHNTAWVGVVRSWSLAFPCTDRVQ